MYLFYVRIFTFDATIKSHYLLKNNLTYVLVSDTNFVLCDTETEFLGSHTKQICELRTPASPHLSLRIEHFGSH